MADLGALLGSLMTGLIGARRMADEQTAALAEYYKTNPLLEGLSVPRIRIPELTIDIPVLIEDYVEGETGEMRDPKIIAAGAKTVLETFLSKNNININSDFHQKFSEEVENQISLLKSKDTAIMNETFTRSVQGAFLETLTKTKTTLSDKEKKVIAEELRAKIPSISISKKPIASSIVANIKTADVKERASSTNVVHLKITLKEEGLEWATQVSDSGSVVRTLQPE